MAEIITKQQNDLNFGRTNILRKTTITFSYRIVDKHIEFSYYIYGRSKKNLHT